MRDGCWLLCLCFSPSFPPSLPVSLKSCFLCSESLALDLECLTTAQMAPIYHCLTCVGETSLCPPSHLSPAPSHPMRPILPPAPTYSPEPPSQHPCIQSQQLRSVLAQGQTSLLPELPSELESVPGVPDLQPQPRVQTPPTSRDSQACQHLPKE